MSISKSPSISLLLLGLLLLLPCTHAQEVPVAAAAAAAPRGSGLDCSEALLNLSACLTYVVQGSNLTRPKKGCCPALAGLVNGEPLCLCQLIASYGGGGGGLGVQVDATRVLTLPTICRVDAPPTSLCAVLGVPVASVSPTSGGPEEAGSGPPAATPENTNDGALSGCGAAAVPPCLFTLSLTAIFLTIYS